MQVFTSSGVQEKLMCNGVGIFGVYHKFLIVDNSFDIFLQTLYTHSILRKGRASRPFPLVFFQLKFQVI